MSYTVELPDGKVVEFPDSVSREQAAQIIRQQLGTGAAPKTGLGAALSKGAANLLSSGRTGIESLFGDATQAGRAGVARGKDISRNYADQVSLDRVTDAYKQRGFLPAVGEAISQIPASLAEQAPNIAATAGGAFTGARLGALAGPVGAVVGGGIGALVPSFVQQFGSNVERQVQEAPGQPVSTGRAAAAGAGQAVLDVAATAIPLGKTILGKILGSKVEQAFLRGDKAAAEALAKESLPKVLAKGTGVGVAAEAPTEVVQAVLERAQAGLPLTSDDALKEYAENAYGAALLSPIGAAGRVTDRSSARDTLESESKKRAIEEARKLKESPEYIQKIATEYEAAQAAFNEAKQGLGKYPKKGTEVEKLEWREKYKQLGLLQNEISDLAPEYRELKPKIDEMRSREQAEAKAAEDAMWMGLRGEAPQGTPETEAPKLVDISALEEALTKEKNATTSEIENAWMEGAGRRRRTPIEEAVYDAVTAAVLDADSAAAIVETALKEGRPDLALYAAKRAARAADSMSTTPGVSEGSPKYESIKKNLVESKQKEQAAARQLLEKATSTAAPVAPPAPANPYEEIGQGIARAYEQRRRAAAPPEQADWENLGVTTPLSAEARKDRNEFVVQQGVAAAQANPELAQNLLASKGKLEIPGLTPQDVRAIYDALNKKVKEDADLEKRRAKTKPAPSTFSLTGSPQQANENLISAARDLQQPNREVVEAEREALLRMGAKPAEGLTALLKKVFGQKDDLTQRSPDLQFVADQLMGQVPRVPPAAENIPGRQRQGLGRTPTRITLQEIVDQMRVKAKALSAARETQNSQAINALRDELADLRAKAQEAEANGGFLYTQPQEPTPEQEAFERATDTRPVTFAPMATPAAEERGQPQRVAQQPGPAGVTLFRGEPATGRKETVGGARFMSPDRKVAEMYAGKDGKISEESHSFKNLLDAPNWVAAKEKLGLGKQNTMADLVDAARDAGHDGVSFSTTNGREYIVIGKNERGQPQRVAQQPGPETALQAAQKKSVAERTELADKAEQLAQTPGLPRARVNALRTLQRALLSGERDAKAARPILERLSRGIETPAPPAEEPQTPTKTVTERRVATPEGVVADVAPAKKKDTERQTKQGLPTEVVVKRAEPLSDEELDREETRAARRAAIKTVQRKTEEAVQASEKAVDDIYATIDRQDLASVTYWSDKMQLEIAELEAASRAAGDDFPKADEAKLRRARTVLKQLEDSQKQLRAAANNAREGTEEKQAERRAAREAERLQAMDEAAKYFKVAEQQDELVALYQSRVNELRSDLISKLIDHNVAMQKIKDLKPIGRELLGVPLDALEDAVTQQRELFTDAIERAHDVRDAVPQYTAAIEALEKEGGSEASGAEAAALRATAEHLSAELASTEAELDLLNRTFETTRAARDVGRLQKQLLSADDVKPTEAELDEYQRALSKAQEREATARAKASEAERTLTRLASEDRLAQEKAAEAARDARLARERQQAEALIEAKERGAGTQYRMLNPVERAFREGAFDVSEEIEQLRAEAIAAGVPKKQLLAQEKRTRQKSDVVSLNRSLGVALKDLAKIEKAIQEGEASMAKAPLTDEAGTRVFKLQKQLESLEAQFAKERSAEKRAVLLERINSLQDRIKNRTTGRDPAIEARLKQLREQQAEAEAAATEAVGQEERMQTRADAYLDRNERVPQILVDAIQAANMRWRAAETQSEALQEKIRQLEDIEPAKQAFKGQGPLMRQRKLLEVRIAEYLDRLQDLGLSETDVAMGGAFEERRAEAARKKLQQAINERKQREAAAVAAGTGEQRMTKQEAKAELAQEKPATSGEALEKSQAKKRLKGEKTAFTGTGGPSGVKALEQERDAVARAKVAADKKLAEQDAVQARADRAAEKRVRAELASVLPTEGALAGADSKVFIYPSVDAFLQTPEGAKYVGKITPNTKGVVLPEGKALLFADNIPEGRALGVLLHDVGVHLGFRKIFTAPELKALANVVRNWATRADNSVERKVGQAALKRVEDAKTPDSQVDEELVGYAVEEATNAGKAPSADKGPVTAWLNRIREKFVAALEKFVGRYNKGTLKLSAQDLVDMAYGAANMELRGVEPQARAGVVGAPTELMFSKSPKYSTDKAAAMGRIAESLVAPQKSMVDRIKLNALGLRTQLVDAMAPVEKFAEYLGKETGDSLRATQLMYNVRMHGETSHFMGLAASTGVVRRQEVKRDDGRTEYILRAEEGANLKDVMRELKDVPGMDPEAANINYSMHRIVKRYRGLSKRKPGATLESLFGTDAEGNPVVSMAKVLEFEKLLDESPDVKAAFERADAIYDQYNKDLMRFLAQSSAISPELADELTRYNDYVPYYRVRNGNVELVVEGMKEGPIRIGNIKDQPHLKELVGGNAAILDFSTSAVNNTHMLLDMGLRNYAARSVAWELKKMGMGAIGSDKVAGEDVFFFYEKGELRSMRVATDALGIPADLLVKGMAGIPMMRFAALQMLGLPARILRQAVVLNPVYALRQVLRDSPASMLVAGANGIPVLSAVQNLKRGPTRDLLERSGVTGGQVYTGSTEDIGMVLRTVNDGKASWMQALRKLESMSMTADAATRAAQYNSYRKQGLSDMEATFMSMESMNFSKRGLSPSMHMVSTMIPFFNAQIQGLDVLYKAARGKMPLNERLKIRQKLFVRGAMLAAGTLAYAALMQDEDEYKNALPEEKYNNWFVRIPGVEPMVRIPIPFELGYIFKAMPEAAFNLLNGSEEGRTVAKAFGTIVKNTIPGGSSMLDVKGVPIPIPLPQAMKPAIEAALGKSFFTGRDIESAPERAMDPEKRVRDTTSGLAKELGELGGFSPVMIDYILRGYLSSIGPLLAQTVSLAIPTGDSPERVVRRLNEYPLVGPLFQPKDGTGVINLVYDRVNEIERAKKTFDDLVSKGNRAEAQQYLRENSDRLSMEGLAGNFTQVMKQVSQAEAAVRAAVGVKSISPQEGREILDKLRQRKIQIAESVKSQMAVRKELQAAR